VFRHLLAAALPAASLIPEALEKCYKENSNPDAFAILQKLLDSLPTPVYIVLDGLDELYGSTQFLLDQLFALVPRAKIFIASRPSAIPKEFDRFVLNLETSDPDDVRKYIATEMDLVGTGLNCPSNEIEMLIQLVTDSAKSL
jgi:hypothetical protein